MDVYEEILKLKKANLPGVLVTIIDKKGHGPQVSGAKMLITDNNKFYGTIGGGALEYAAINEYENILKAGCTQIKKYNLDENGKLQDGIKTGMVCGGEITLFYECIKIKPSVCIFGGGHVGQAVVYFLKPLGYDITVVDSRDNIEINFDAAVKYKNLDCEKFIEDFKMPDDSFVVITTHSHDLDYKVLKKIYESNYRPGYIGLIASKKKSVQMINRLVDELEQKPNLDILYSPIGLKIGGSSPAEIGLSIVSELQALRYKTEGNKHSSKNWKSELSDQLSARYVETDQHPSQRQKMFCLYP